jgi:sugar lactone lactonase YvrE
MLPQLRKLERAFPDGLVVIGVHSGKFIAERKTENIRRAVERLGLHHPVVNDRQFRVWRAYAVSAWPTLTLIDAAGYVVAQQAGEIPAEALIPVVERLIADARADGSLDLSPVAFPPDGYGATSGPLRFPAKLAADAPNGRLFVADTGNDRVLSLRVDAGGRAAVLEWAAGGAAAGLRDGSAEHALFRAPHGVAFAGDRLFVADTGNHAIRVVDLRDASVSTIAGTGAQAHRWSRPGDAPASPAAATPLSSPWDVAVHRDALFIAMAGTHQIWRLELARSAIAPWAGSGAEALVDGPAASAALAQPSGLALHRGRLWFADSESSALRWADLEHGAVHTIVGTGLFDFGDHDGVGDRVRLQHPLAVAIDDDGLFVADTYNNRIKRVDPAAREVTSWIGDDARLHEPGGLSLDRRRLWVADTNNHRIVMIDRATADVVELELSPPSPQP